MVRIITRISTAATATAVIFTAVAVPWTRLHSVWLIQQLLSRRKVILDIALTQAREALKIFANTIYQIGLA